MSSQVEACGCMKCAWMANTRLDADDPVLRAYALLMRYLDPQQRLTFIHEGYFLVEGSGKGTYSVSTYGPVQRVVLSDSGAGRQEILVIHSYCVGPAQFGLPYGDRALTLMLWIQGDERAFLLKANRL